MTTLSLDPGAAIDVPPFRRVVAATSLDASGVRAGLRAARLPLAPGARLVLLHVLPPAVLARSRRSPDQARGALEGEAEAVREVAAHSGNRDPRILAVCTRGWPATEIVRVAWQERAELIVVGPPAVRADGSPRGTISRVIRSAGVPLLVARSDPAKAYERILCAIDRSVAASDTVALAARLAATTARSFTLFHAVHVPFDDWVRGDAELQEDALERLRALARSAATHVAVTRTVVRRGDHRLKILGAAAGERADLVTLGTRGRSGLSRILFGSTAEWVIANSPFDVGVARPHRLWLEAQPGP